MIAGVSVDAGGQVEIDQDIVVRQLDRLLESSDFQAPSRLKKFLEFVVQETLKGRAGSVKAYSIAVEVFGRDESFDPLLDPIVRVEAGKLRRQLERYYFLNPDEPLCISIPRGSYVPVFSYKGNDKVVIVGGAQPPGPAAEEFSWRVSAAGIQADAEPAPLLSNAERRPALVIMPFTMIGADRSLDCFVEGLNESLLAGMSHSSDVDVLEVAAIGADEHNLLETISRAQALGSRFILHGRVQLFEDSVRIFSALTDAQSARRIWTGRFDSLLDNASLRELQDEVSRKLVGWLTDSFGLINRTFMRESMYKNLEDIGVYEASLRYHTWVGSFDKNDWIKARQALEHSIELDPENSMVCALLSDVYSSDYEFGYDQLENNLDLAQDLAKRALALDPTSQMAHWALALNYYLRMDIVRMHETIGRIFPNKNINPYLFVSLGLITGMTKDLAEGKRLVEEALRLNPCSPSWCHVIPFMYHYAHGQYEEALSEALQMNIPTCIWDAIARAASYAKLGMKGETEKAIAQLLVLEPDFKLKQKRLLHAMVIDSKWVNMLAGGLACGGL